MSNLSPYFKMIMFALIASLAILLSGCFSAVPVVPKEAPRQLPIQAMAECPKRLPEPHDDLDIVPWEIAKSRLKSLILRTQAEYFACKEKQERLVDWIESGR